MVSFQLLRFDDHIRKDVVCWISSFNVKTIVVILPITIWTLIESPNVTLIVAITNSLNKSAIGRDKVGRIMDVNLDKEWSECVGNDVVFKGVSNAVSFNHIFVWVDATSTVGLG
jgi:hypothetical protein